MKQLFFLCLILNLNFSYAQCEVKKMELKDNITLSRTSEKFYTNEDLENGLKSFYVSLNLYSDKSNPNSSFVCELVVTYVWSGYYTEMTPNKIRFKLESGKELYLVAESKSSGTINGQEVPEKFNSIECTFLLSSENIKQLLEYRTISEFTIIDYKTNESFDFSEGYKGQFPEMLSCVIRK